jgi:hypothetical protein
MKPTEKMGTRNMDSSGKTRPTSTQGIASPKVKGTLKEAQGIIQGNAKKAGEGLIQEQKDRGGGA